MSNQTNSFLNATFKKVDKTPLEATPSELEDNNSVLSSFSKEANEDVLSSFLKEANKEPLDVTSYGQIQIYDHYFGHITETPQYSPAHCIEFKLSYVVPYNTRSLPVMIGSKIHRNHKTNIDEHNPLRINGYFIIDGLFKSVNNIKLKLNINFNKNQAYLSDGSRIEMKSMMSFLIHNKNKSSKWHLPVNWKNILDYSPIQYKEKLLYYLTIIRQHSQSISPPIKSEIDLASLAYMFLAWFNLINQPPIYYRLLTPGELINDAISKKENVVKYFKNNSWHVKYMYNISTVSENMQNNNIISNIESVRRITYPKLRENLPLHVRTVKNEDKYKICPVQTSDGSLCGTVHYLVKDAKLTYIDNIDIVISTISDFLLSFKKDLLATPSELNNSVLSTFSKVASKDVLSPSELERNNSVLSPFLKGGNEGASESSFSKGGNQNNKSFIFINNKLHLSLFIEKNLLNNLLNKLSSIATIKSYHNFHHIFTQIGQIINGKYSVSYAASLIPYRLHNPPIRSMFVSSMLKQAIPQAPLTSSYNKKLLVKGEQPLTPPYLPENLGHNLLTAIMPWYGYNVEDAIVISSSAAKKFSYQQLSYYISSQNEKIINVYVSENQQISQNQPLYMTYNPLEVKTINIIKASQNSKILSIKTIEDSYIKITTLEEKQLEIGDKMTSRHGQKGVISLIQNTNQMPYYLDHNNNKIFIDLIINPHAFPSRMTMGQILEISNHGSYKNLIGIKNKILVGPCYYMSLKHKVAEKIQYRHLSNLNNIVSRQPLQGKKNNGGLRFGQMERDILLGIGAWKTLSHFWSIDKTYIFINIKTGQIYHSLQEPHHLYKKHFCRQYFKIILAYLRAIGKDILWFPHLNSYQVSHFNHSTLPKTNTLSFGNIEVLDLRIYKNIPVLPLALRSQTLSKLYSKNISQNYHKINKEISSILKSKNGPYHTLIEGHRINNCIRSVITPNPLINPYSVKLPKNINPPYNYAILNRQPTLNTSSMLLVSVSKGTTNSIQIHPKICKLFNADFDGDEMNLYGIQLDSLISELKPKLYHKLKNTQDYTLTNHLSLPSLADLTTLGITASQSHIQLMINANSKGKQFNYDHIYNNIPNTSSNYLNGLSEDDWYYLSKLSRISAVSIALNTPVSGYLQSISNNHAI